MLKKEKYKREKMENESRSRLRVVYKKIPQRQQRYERKNPKRIKKWKHMENNKSIKECTVVQQEAG